MRSILSNFLIIDCAMEALDAFGIFRLIFLSPLFFWLDFLSPIVFRVFHDAIPDIESMVEIICFTK
jgi:hypothetical protein